MQKEMSQFFQICNKPSLLSKYKDNQVVYTFCKIVSDKFITFPKYEIEDLKFHGFPNDEYQEARWKQFPNILEQVLKEDTEEKIKIIRDFLESCHGDDSTRDSKNNIHESEFLYYHKLFTKSNCIPLDYIYKAYPELKKENEESSIGYFVPTGTIIEISHSNGITKFNDVQNSKISLDFLKFPFRKEFEATIVISPKWLTHDDNFYKNRNAKWQELRINGFKTNDIKVYILKCNKTKKWLKEIFEKAGLKTICLNPIQIESTKDLKDSLIDCLNRKYRGVIFNKDMYVVKRTTAKNIKIDGTIPMNSFPYDLSNFNIHYSYIPEDFINE